MLAFPLIYSGPLGLFNLLRLNFLIWKMVLIKPDACVTMRFKQNHVCEVSEMVIWHVSCAQRM